MKCYQCDEETNWLAPDSRCGNCTNLTPDEVAGEVPIETQDLNEEEELLF